MHNGTVSVRLIANELRHKFLARYMATQIKKNHKTTRPKNNRRTRAPRRSSGSAAPKAPALRRTRPILKEQPAPRDEELLRDEEEPKPEDLAKEEPIKPEEVEEATAALETTPDVAAAEPRPRERSGYDGDTAIKLYLR